jgi:hypothetical protein
MPQDAPNSAAAADKLSAKLNRERDRARVEADLLAIAELEKAPWFKAYFDRRLGELEEATKELILTSATPETLKIYQERLKTIRDIRRLPEVDKFENGKARMAFEDRAMMEED